jgi:hypothetical protein
MNHARRTDGRREASGARVAVMNQRHEGEGGGTRGQVRERAHR